jgi:hypothetical protein
MILATSTPDSPTLNGTAITLSASSYSSVRFSSKVKTKESGGSFVDVMKNFDYGPHGKVTEKNFHNGATTTLTYDANALYRLTIYPLLSSRTCGF